MTIESQAVDTPELASDFAAHVAALCPGFVAHGSARPARKSQLIEGRIGERAVIAKQLKKPNAVWAWYLEHEVAIYRAFAAHASGVRAPRLVAATSDLLVVELLAGEPLSHPRAYARNCASGCSKIRATRAGSATASVCAAAAARSRTSSRSGSITRSPRIPRLRSATVTSCCAT